MHSMRAISRSLLDREPYLKIARSIITHVDRKHHKRLFSIRFLTFEQAPRLGVQDCFDLLEHSILKAGRATVFTRLPAARDLSPDQVHDLMQLCMQTPSRSAPSPALRYAHGGCDSGSCSSSGPKWEAQPPSHQMGVTNLAQLPSAANLRAQQLAGLIQTSLLHKEGPQRRAIPTNVLEL
jgi:hypothetical protein